ncbi:MAG TPA: hypothetical protein VJB90_02835 [Candidatus Nanoarchaeia archaeon]|nr:hypothetical protein [Candidatus Nanoarchaeia archaeon]
MNDEQRRYRGDNYFLEDFLGVPSRGETIHGAPTTRPYLCPPDRTSVNLADQKHDESARVLDARGAVGPRHEEGRVVGEVEVDYNTGAVTFRKIR